jgi:hypothetical protein
MTALGEHAQAELELIGAPDGIKFALIDMVGTFADLPAEDWSQAREYLEKLLSFGALSQLTNGAAEWTLLPLGDVQAWQSTRTPDAWSKDPNHNTYFLISELEANGMVILHPTAPATP